MPHRKTEMQVKPTPEKIDTTNHRDHLSNVTQTGKRIWIYPRIVKGLLYKYRTWFSWLLMAGLFAGPFLEWDGHPIFMFNVLERQFIFFGVPFWPQDFHLVALGLITFMVFIVLFTVVFGRVWCGWACPQTIFMEMLFRKIENWIEGDYKAQQRLDAMPWNSEKLLKKTSKHVLFFVLSFAIANTFLAYIIGKKALLQLVEEGPVEHWGSLLALLIFTGVFYFVFARFRELVCIVVCPYGRLQGVLLDKKSIVVAYDYVRGEPRGHQKKGEERALGDCIDCSLCVQVCPTGIDIRNGTQLECVNCTACIDACDEVMLKIDKPTGLVRYDSLEGIEEKIKLRFSTRIIGYAAVLTVLVGVLATLLLFRADLEATLLRTPGLTYQEDKQQGTVSNLYNLELVNKTFKDMPIEIRLADKNLAATAELKPVGEPMHKLEANQMAKGSLFITMQADKIQTNNTPIVLEIWSKGQKMDQVKTNFMAPMKPQSNTL